MIGWRVSGDGGDWRACLWGQRGGGVWGGGGGDWRSCLWGQGLGCLAGVSPGAGVTGERVSGGWGDWRACLRGAGGD